MDVTKAAFKKCPLCPKSFASCKLKNRHIKRIHKIVADSGQRSLIVCPLCEQRNEVKTHNNLRKHLKEKHEVTTENVSLQFFSSQDYKMWKTTEKIETNYAKHRVNNCNDHKEVHYDCNRSDIRGFESNTCKRAEKSGGTIKMRGVCPSKLVVKIYDNGEKVLVNFWKTHVGHDEELRSKHLSALEKKMVIDKLKSGVPVDRILEDARKLETPKLERINLLSRSDVTYLLRKHKVENRRDKNEMVAAALKVQERNANGKKFAVFFKQQGDTHAVLKKEDVALGFMNSTMEDKLKFVEEKMRAQDVTDQLDAANRRRIRSAQIINWLDSLDDKTFDKFATRIEDMKEDYQKTKPTGSKRKMET